ncbi:hypothetical protein BFR57_09060 [Idiomarina sp. MD25a]|uniref:DUF1285 domain-containing protein n=1 Tax=Idiomarina sp. MD25a TaxID=1889913 RepID=UPI0008F884BE|nr:DUF1285 domain-containing protein [Idiomarina sp. MD25a]OIM97872.1 hypothetical protein BFR57_09060 [Idiomarina sp. MD25a]
MSLNDLAKQLESYHHAPTEKWDPPYCGEIPMFINEQGEWLYQGSPITRKALVKLFASVLTFESGEYFLITPAEKMKISVADAPFLIIDWKFYDYEGETVIQVVTNIDERYILNEQLLSYVKDDVPYFELPTGLTAKVHRNVFYQWVEIAQQRTLPEATELFLHSAGHDFVIGRLAN